MKILNLRFKNISSLKGEWEIAFDRYPLSDAAVFAITGPNGSGKTSILDSISLALYGQTFRLQQPAEQIITRDAPDCYSEVTFSLGSASYRARWNFSRGDGTARAEAMELTQLNGEERVLANRVTDVRSQVAQLTGLDFKRFTRSIMLAQGDFSAFLHALDSERAEVLEKITGTDVYADYFERFDRDLADAQEKLKRLQAEVDSVPLVDAAGFKALEDDVAECESHCGEQKAVREALEKELEWHRALQRLQQTIDRDALALTDAQQRRSRCEADLQRVDAAHKARAYQPDLDALDEKKRAVVKVQAVLESQQGEADAVEQELAGVEAERAEADAELERIRQALESFELKKRIKAYRGERKKSQKAASEVDRSIRKRQKALAKADKWLSRHDKDRWLAEAFAEVGYQLGRLKMAQDRRALAQSRYQTAAQVCKERMSELAKFNDAVAGLESKVARIRARRDNKAQEMRGVTGGASLQELEARYTETIARLDHFLQLGRIFDQYQSLVGERGRIRKKASKKEPALHELQKQHEALRETLVGEENIWRTLDSAVRNEAYIRLFDEQRQILEEGQRCPLCGSYDHPFVTEGVPDTDSRKALAAQTKKVEALQKKLDALAARMARLDQTPALSLTEQKIGALLAEWNSLRIMLELPAEKLNKEAMEPIRREQRSLRLALQRQEKRIKEAMKYGQALDTFDREIGALEAEVAKRRAHIDRLDADLDRERGQLLELEHELQTARKEEQTQEEALRARLAEHDITMPAKNGRFVRGLESKTAGYRQHVQEKQALEKALSELGDRAQTLADELHRLDSQYTVDNRRLEEIEAALVGQPRKSMKALNKELTAASTRRDSLQQRIDAIQGALHEKRAQIEEQSAELTALREALAAAERDLRERSSADGFDTIEALRGSLLSVEEQQRIRQTQDAVASEIESLQVRIEAARTELESVRSRGLSDESLEQVEYRLQQAAEQERQLKEQLARADEALREQYEHRDLHDEMQQRLEEQRAECARLQQEKRAIDQESESQRRKRVQGLLFDRLLALSNRHLEKISGRYIIRRNGDDDFGLMIEDTEQGGFRRGIETLSGGESFVVSLALALGLSDIANNGTRIDSLFLDEGLGSLDEETLYMVLSTLEGLHKNGKTVGVISHVKELKERIHTQIRAVKLGGGISRLEVVP